MHVVIIDLLISGQEFGLHCYTKIPIAMPLKRKTRFSRYYNRRKREMITAYNKQKKACQLANMINPVVSSEVKVYLKKLPHCIIKNEPGECIDMQNRNCEEFDTLKKHLKIKSEPEDYEEFDQDRYLEEQNAHYQSKQRETLQPIVETMKIEIKSVDSETENGNCEGDTKIKEESFEINDRSNTSEDALLTPDSLYECECCEKKFDFNALKMHLGITAEVHDYNEQGENENDQTSEASLDDQEINEMDDDASEKPQHSSNKLSKKGILSDLPTVQPLYYSDNISMTVHQCQYCIQIFANDSDLKAHFCMHTKCINCKKKHKRHEDLVKHLSVATREVHYECEYCSKTFVNYCDLKIHLKAHPYHYLKK